MKHIKRNVAILPLVISSLFFPSFSYADEQTATIQQEGVIQSQVNINTATVEELTKVLAGIGNNKAQKIIEYRDNYGPFISIEQLKEVSGIGQSILDKNKGRIVL